MKKIIVNKFIIKKDVKGYGVYAARDFKKGEKIHVLGGKISTPKSIALHQKNFKRGIIDPLQIGDDKYLELDALSVKFNHSCDPNASLREMSTLYAFKNIKKGEEITYDYSTTIDESFWCKCGSKNCRGVIYDFFSLPNKAKRYYFGNNALPAHIMKKYKKLLSADCPCGARDKEGRRIKYKHHHGK